MKVLIFYRPESEQSRSVDEFVHEFSHRYPGAELSLVDVDSVNGMSQAAVYDVMRHPTVIAVGSDGATLQRWDNGMMPLINEVAYYTNQ
jgi:methyl coenzyme M reductase alpha subunit